jgi:hypothetical protein
MASHFIAATANAVLIVKHCMWQWREPPDYA